ncbi:MAG: putative serine/threonine protein kinase, partial [Ilumatobacteraceae bacterium]|nr:putative serine/threonine protein kinase [Ilumatobacteraceae bacterium]
MVASEQHFSGRVVAGRYRLGPRRGSGIDAAVFDAFDQRMQRVVSLQVVHPDISTGTDFRDAFRPTMEIAAGLDHPNVATIYDFGSDDWKGRETFYVAVEHLSGGSLRDVLDRGRTLTPSQTLSIGLDVLRALEVVHRAGLIHGDVRPSTIVFGQDRQLKMIDVGLGQLLARMLWSDVVHVSIERAMYASPEVAAREQAVPKSDVYSLSLTMLECVTGHVPFVGDSTVATLSNRVGRLLPVSADLGALASVLERAGRPDPEGRFTVAEFGQALVRTAPKLPRPAPIAVLGASLFDRDATRGLMRPAAVPHVAPAAQPVAPPADAPAADVPTADAGTAPAPAADPASPIHDPLIAAASAITGAAPGPEPAAAAPPVDEEPGSEPQPEDEPTGAAPPVASEPANDALAWASKLPSGEAASLPPPGTGDRDGGDDLLSTQAMPRVESPPTELIRPPAEPVPEPTRLMPAIVAEPTQVIPTVVPAPVLYDEEHPPRRHRSRWWWFIPILLVLAAAGGTVAYLVNRTVSHRVPDLTGLSQGAALNQVSGLGWTTLTPQEASETVAIGQVIRTDPVPGTKLNEGRSLTIVVSTGPAPRPLPELKGLTLDAATTALTSLGLKIQQGDAVFDDNVPSGSVVAWMVPDQPNLVAGNTVTPGVTVQVQLSKGPAPRLPELKGLTLDAATQALAAQQLKIAQAAPANDEAVPTGQVLTWSIPGHPELIAGSVVDPGVVVQVVLSAGPAPRTVPSLAGKSAVDAQAAIEGLGLVYAQLPDQFSPTVPAGTVVSQDPAASSQVPKGSTVSVAISKGPDVVAMPDLTNQPLQPAQNALSAAGLGVGTVTGNANGVVTAATVAGLGVTPGQLLPRGTAVDLSLT